ncbi:DUF4870 domain-containing protein [Natronorubrum aibiense]|uniref:DUF4870 domain-containing protein n=1 Tax=Natronorubrum aibiense TaxID=348826 RepID=UPI001D044DB9|nr:DUF4870 domain-containing protein [Natronorubrum aibiense]
MDTTFAAITHVLGRLTWIVGPLIVLLVTEDEFVEENARNALNWQLMFTIYRKSRPSASGLDPEGEGRSLDYTCSVHSIYRSIVSLETVPAVPT